MSIELSLTSLSCFLFFIGFIYFGIMLYKEDKTNSATAKVLQTKIEEVCLTIDKAVHKQESALSAAIKKHEAVLSATTATNQILMKQSGKVKYIKDMQKLMREIEIAYLSSDAKLAKQLLCSNLLIRYEKSKVEYLNSIKDADKDVVAELNTLLRLASLYEIVLPAPLENLQSFKNYKRSVSFRPAETAEYNNPAFGKACFSAPFRNKDSRNTGNKRK